MRHPLTDRQRQTLDFITYYQGEHGYAPTLREIGAHMGIRSTNGVNDHIKALERKGYLERQELKSRTLRVVDDSKVSVPISVAGQVTNHITIDRELIGGAPSAEVFGLVIRGDSMIEDGIFDGDYIFARKQATAKNGEIVLVTIEGETTCKRIYHEADRVRLQPANASMSPIYVHRSDFSAIEILGRVIGVYRRLR